ncbi:UPAR/Ly6 domain-containing protein cold-like [Artemia franciscana]|uniref:UPAR/Ly6 domain-containing protein cold-like n=1 Tax=Artemia franciscana TaxID=6661 RepID=UPI0032DA20F2
MFCYNIYTLFSFLFLFQLGSALECYVCNEQEGNTDKCLKTIKICEQHEDMCMTKIKWGSLPYWTITAAKQFNVSKECATKDLCEQTWNATLPYCERIWYLDWRCSECCAGDRCNYYVTLGSSSLSANAIFLGIAAIAVSFLHMLPV